MLQNSVASFRIALTPPVLAKMKQPEQKRLQEQTEGGAFAFPVSHFGGGWRGQGRHTTVFLFQPTSLASGMMRCGIRSPNRGFLMALTIKIIPVGIFIPSLHTPQTRTEMCFPSWRSV